MRKSLVATVLLVLGAVATTASLALSDGRFPGDADGIRSIQWDTQKASELRSRALRLGTSTNPSDLDTTWIGYTPGHTADNYWSIWAGHGKQSYNQPKMSGVNTNGSWGFEETVHGDTLQGWWPMIMRYLYQGGKLNDRDRPMAATDWGNVANYNLPGASRTVGVLGVWHVDGGNAQAQGTVTDYGDPIDGIAEMYDPPPPGWSPTEGAGAAWMGLRAHGDQTAIDPITNNAFNEDVLLIGGNTVYQYNSNYARRPAARLTEVAARLRG